MLTEIMQKLASAPDVSPHVPAAVPLGVGSVDDVANAVAFASDDSSWGIRCGRWRDSRLFARPDRVRATDMNGYVQVIRSVVCAGDDWVKRAL
jgi:hypothetical protein